jgi:hypothetical protein
MVWFDETTGSNADFPERRLRRKKGRRKPVAEITCNCGAYRFPHRFGGGACTGILLAEQRWAKRDCGDCHSIAYDSQTFAAYCRVVDGGDSLEECEMLQEFMRRNEIRIRGIKWK